MKPVEKLLQAGVVGAGLPRVGQGGADARQQQGALAGHGVAVSGPVRAERTLGIDNRQAPAVRHLRGCPGPAGSGATGPGRNASVAHGEAWPGGG